ncbi:MAG: Dabb family protein, partial [Bacteroidota bacterium]
MIKHIVVFKLKEFAEGKTKKENVLIIKDILECLPAK